MPDKADVFDIDAVRRAWDHATEAYAEGQRSGRDFYRYEFFGPEHVELCGDVDGLRLLDIGCGTGYFSREMARRGADVTGVDVSPRMIDQARRLEAEAPLGISYFVSDAARLETTVSTDSMDMVTSCVALQDMPNVPGVLDEVCRALKPGGRVVVSITHPCSDMPYREWERDADGRKRWLCVDRYFDRGPLTYRWNGWAYDFDTPALHVTLADWIGWFLERKLRLTALREPQPTAETLRRRPELQDAARIPYYLLLDLASPVKAET